MIDGMTYLYEMLKIGHCDIKPANFLIMDDEYSLTITDYGLARQLMKNAIKESNAFTIKGTSPYFSPEMMLKFLTEDEENPINIEKSDVFSVGLTIIKLSGFNIKGLNLNSEI